MKAKNQSFFGDFIQDWNLAQIRIPVFVEIFQKTGRFLSETVPLLRNRFHMLRSFHGKSHLHPLLFSSTLSPCRGRDSSLPVRLPPLRDSFFCGVVGAASMRPARSPLPPIPRETTGGIYAAPTKRQRTVSTACCLIYLLYTLSQVFVDSRILTW